MPGYRKGRLIMMEIIRILAINPGSTSTKIAVFENEDKVYGLDITHEAERLARFKQLSDQFDYRKQMIIKAMDEQGYDLRTFTAFVGRAGGLDPCSGGTYPVNDLMLDHARSRPIHPAALGPLLAHDLSMAYDKPAFVVNPPDVDELEPVARVSGIADLPRSSSFHALSHKEVGLRAAAKMGKPYTDVNLVVAHIGGGVSVAAHKKGRVVDADNLLYGEAPMAPTRAGVVPPSKLISLCFSGQYSERKVKELFMKNGGLVNHLGTSEVLEVKQRIAKGDRYAKLVYDAMIYQVAKSIGAYATVLEGKVDAIVLTGGISRDSYFIEELTRMVAFIAPVDIYPGELEMEALALGVLRVISGTEDPVAYTGQRVWEGFDSYKGRPQTGDRRPGALF